MFDNMRRIDPVSDTQVSIGKLSYVWAGLFGPLFVLIKAGPLRALYAVGLSLACAIGLIGIVANIHFVPGDLRPVALVFVIPGVLLFHALQTVALVTNYYRDRQWAIRLY